MNRTSAQREYIDNVRSAEQPEWPLAVAAESTCSMDATRTGMVCAFPVESIEAETPVLSRCASTPVLNSGSALPLREGEATPVLDLSLFPGGSLRQGVVNELVGDGVVSASVGGVVVSGSADHVVMSGSLQQVGLNEPLQPVNEPLQPVNEPLQPVNEPLQQPINDPSKPIETPESVELTGIFQSSNPIESAPPTKSSSPTPPPSHPRHSPPTSPSTPTKTLKRTSSQAPILSSIPLFFSQEPVVVPTLDESSSEEKKSRLSLPSDLVRPSSLPHL